MRQQGDIGIAISQEMKTTLPATTVSPLRPACKVMARRAGPMQPSRRVESCSHANYVLPSTKKRPNMNCAKSFKLIAPLHGCVPNYFAGAKSRVKAIAGGYPGDEVCCVMTPCLALLRHSPDCHAPECRSSAPMWNQNFRRIRGRKYMNPSPEQCGSGKVAGAPKHMLAHRHIFQSLRLLREVRSVHGKDSSIGYFRVILIPHAANRQQFGDVNLAVIEN